MKNGTLIVMFYLTKLNMNKGGICLMLFLFFFFILFA